MARSVASGQPRPLDELTVIVALSEIKEAALSKEMNSTRDTWGLVLVLVVVVVVGLVLVVGFSGSVSTGPRLADRSWWIRERLWRRRASEVHLRR